MSQPERRVFTQHIIDYKKEKKRIYAIQYKKDNPNAWKKWNEKNKEYRLNYQNFYDKKHRKERREKAKERYYKNKKSHNKRAREWKDKNKDRIKEYNKNNPEIFLKSRQKRLRRMAEKLKLGQNEYMYALMNWSDCIMKNFNSLCQICYKKAEHAHHILYRAKYPELSLNVNNGIPLCRQHHYEVHGQKLLVITR